MTRNTTQHNNSTDTETTHARHADIVTHNLTRNHDYSYTDIATPTTHAHRALDLPDTTTKTAISIIEQAAAAPGDKTEHLARGYNPMCAAAISIACKKHNTPRTLEEISNAIDTPPKSVREERLKLEHALGEHYHAITPDAWIRRYGNDLEYTSDELTDAIDTHLPRVRADNPNGRPRTNAAVALWLTNINNDLGLTKRRVADVTNVTPVTLRKHTPDQDTNA